MNPSMGSQTSKQNNSQAEEAKVNSGNSESNIDFTKRLQEKMESGFYSEATHKSTHIPELASSTSEIDVVLLGDSMFEYFKGTSTKIASMKNAFNAAVAGDRIQNVLYRINLGLLDLLKNRNVKLFVIHIGTNNLYVVLDDKSMEAYQILLEAIRRSFPDVMILVTGLFIKRGLDPKNLDISNQMIRKVVEDMSSQMNNKISFFEAPNIDKSKHLVDGLHLNEEGYEIWDDALYSEIQRVLQSVETS